MVNGLTVIKLRRISTQPKGEMNVLKWLKLPLSNDSNVNNQIIEIGFPMGLWVIYCPGSLVLLLHRLHLFLINCHISPYDPASQFNHDPLRRRKLLFHKKEIHKLSAKADRKGFNLIPLKIYLKRGRAKVELGVATGKKDFDKRDLIPLTAVSDRHTNQYRLLSNKSTQVIDMSTVTVNRQELQTRKQELQSKLHTIKSGE